MSSVKKISVLDLQSKKQNNEKIICLTAYGYNIARIIDEYVDIILVGDSLGMTLYGMNSTIEVSMEMMINHGRAVNKAAKHAFVVVDMPFSTVTSAENTFINAAKIISQTGAQAVKVEGGQAIAENIQFLTDRGVAVIGHIGLMPQHIHKLGGFKAQGTKHNDQEIQRKLLQDAKAIEAAGAFAIVIEATKRTIVEYILDHINIPVIGIGASPKCDGQILVSDDIFGISPHIPKFAQSFAHFDINNEFQIIIQQFVDAVKSGKFPADKHCFN